MQLHLAPIWTSHILSSNPCTPHPSFRIPKSCIPTSRVPASYTAAPGSLRARGGGCAPIEHGPLRVTVIGSGTGSSPGTPGTAGLRPPSLPIAPPPAPHCSLPRLPGGGGGCSLLKGPSPLLVVPAGREHQWGGACPRPPPPRGPPDAAPEPRSTRSAPFPGRSATTQASQERRQGYSDAGVWVAPSGGANPNHPVARDLGRRAERSGSSRLGPEPPR